MTSASVHFVSPALEGPATYTIFVPDPVRAGPGPYPVLLQLHGRYDDHRAWPDKSRLALYVEPLPLIVVMPSGGNFWWSNLAPELGLRYEDFLLQDLWTHVQTTFPARPKGPWVIGGLSMGGYGAIHLGLKHPTRFASIFAHSSAVPTADELHARMPFLPPATVADMDVYTWAARRTPADLPHLGFDCGLDDELLPANRRFAAHLSALGLPHAYVEHPGAHTWDYWDLHVQQALVQHCLVLGIAPLPA